MMYTRARSAVSFEALAAHEGSNPVAEQLLRTQFPDSCTLRQAIRWFDTIRVSPAETTKIHGFEVIRKDQPALQAFYGLSQVPSGKYFWAGDRLPFLTQRVRVLTNNMGIGTVIAYFVEWSHLGVEVELDNPPDWFKDAHGPLVKSTAVQILDLEPIKQ